MQASPTATQPPSPANSEHKGEVIALPVTTRSSFTLEAGPEQTEFEVPDGGLQAWMTVAGAWLTLFSTFGRICVHFWSLRRCNYYVRVYLTDHSASSIAWIGSFQLMMPFFCGPVSGKIFDNGGFHALEIVGGIIFTVSSFLLSLAKPNQYYQIFLAQGVGMGLGVGLIFLPSLSIVVHHFKRHRGLASGIIMSGTSVGATLFPIMLNHLLPRVGFARAVRYSSAIIPPCLVIGNLMMRTRLPPRSKRGGNQSPPDIKSFFKDPPYLVGILGMLLGLLGLFFPAIYIQLYGVQHDVDPTLSFYSLSVLNAAGAVVRVAGNHFADVYGPFNAMTMSSTISGALIWALLGINSGGSLMVVSIIYGASSSAWLALTFPSFASLAKGPEEVGARLGIALSLTSLAVLGSSPLQGHLLTGEYHWIRPVAFSATMVFGSAICFMITRTLYLRTRKVNGWRA
ncbi:MFS general substrate transporter [Mycena indigotica]|uniref:MFS general substrate transporter n=1 Tax=Mycena indigotica TaxID=2126181 RepID=A0A8H6RZN3_9AGAR|nr:MFS general substrate transporter [Mycena indigotica]KAF7289331.1 MFS general substrate transporter [Mycena indigotica]